MQVSRFFTLLVLLSVITLCSVCTNKNGGDPVPPETPVQGEWWITKADQSAFLQKQAVNISFTSTANTNANLEIDSSSRMQTIDGFGYTLTGGSAMLINAMNT